MKKLFQSSRIIYLLLTVLGIVCIGLGCGISVFELSDYKTANYRAVPADPDLPLLEMQTTTLEAAYEKGAQFKLDATDWCFSSYDIQYDNSLNDKVRIEVTAPKDLYNVYLTTQGENYYFLHCNADDFSRFRFMLDMSKDGYIPENLPPVTMTLTMSETQAKNFKLNEERYKTAETETAYQEQLNDEREAHNQQLRDLQEQYNQQIADLQEQHQEQIQNMQEEHNTRIEELQENFNQQQEEQRQQYEQQISDLQEQLNNVRNSLG